MPLLETAIVAVIIYGTILLFFTRVGKDTALETILRYPNSALWTPAILFGVYLYYCFHTGGIHWLTALKVLIYYTVPSVSIWIAARLAKKRKDYSSRLTFWDGIAILSLWLLFDLHWVTRRPNAIPNALDWPLIGLSGMIIGLVFWVTLRELDGTKTRPSLSPKYFSLVLRTLLGLAVILISLGISINFLAVRDLGYAENGLLRTIFNHLATWQLLFYTFKLFITVAIMEEFMFRGIIQNFLDRTLNNQASSLTFASILFGLAHLNNGAQSLSPWDWNWKYAFMASIAGLGYGWVFRQTNSILYAVLLHALVDSIWHTFFKAG